MTERFVRSQIHIVHAVLGATLRRFAIYGIYSFTEEVEIEIAGELIDCILALWGQYVSASSEFKYLGQGRVFVMDSNCEN